MILRRNRKPDNLDTALKSFDAGFECGMKHAVQVMADVINNCYTSEDALRSMNQFIIDFWKERES